MNASNVKCFKQVHTAGKRPQQADRMHLLFVLESFQLNVHNICMKSSVH